MCAPLNTIYATTAFFRSAKEAMAAMFDWVWLPVDAKATPTLTRDLKPLIFAGAARRGGLRASAVTFSPRAVEGRYAGRKDEEEEGLDGQGMGESDNSFASDDGPIITTLEEME